MVLKLYNTLTRKKEIFKPIKKKQVSLYSCGPTVYLYQHIGNLRTYIFSDILKRTLTYNDYKVNHVMNVTDVGHLTSDADTGEDKIEKAAKKEGKTAKEITNYYFKIFREDLGKLNIIEPIKWVKATEHIKEQIELVKKLEKKGFTYKTSDGIYFNTSKLKDYGKLSRIKKENIKGGKRISLGEKKNNTDFALWKFSPTSDKRQQEWKSPWGVGFPGWHLECSAMSMKYLGGNFDIHTGGLDHVPVHHTNEIAQSEIATGKKFVNYWMHAGWLLLKGEKMAKSKEGFYTISELEKKEFSPLEFRYMCLTTHYKKPLDFSLKNLESAKNSYKRMKNIILSLNDDKKENEKYIKKFEEKINDGLNMPKALQVLWELLRDEKAKGKIKTIKKMDEVFGLDLLKKEKIEIPKEVIKLAEERLKARVKKDWKKSDSLRKKIGSLEYIIEDKEKSYVLKKK
jgi:cysteinyl-tRNA synthetase